MRWFMEVIYDFFTSFAGVCVIVAAGYLVGRVRVRGISLGLAGVLICSVFFGAAFSACGFDVSSVPMFGVLSKIGTSLFVACVGMRAGRSIRRVRLSDAAAAAVCGMLVSALGFLVMNVIALSDSSVPRSVMLGILCGAMTNTPAMAAAGELCGINAAEVALGYGSAYLFGVVFIVLAVQFMTGRRCEATIMERGEFITGNTVRGFVWLCVCVAAGSAVGKIPLPFSGVPIGWTAGTLTVSAVFGYYGGKRALPQKCSELLRGIGLMLFFVGTGVPAGAQAIAAFSPVWVIYGAIITVVPVVAVGIIYRRLFGNDSISKAVVISGGMTSTPAICALMSRNGYLPLGMYSASYASALLFTVLGVGVF